MHLFLISKLYLAIFWLLQHLFVPLHLVSITHCLLSNSLSLIPSSRIHLFSFRKIFTCTCSVIWLLLRQSSYCIITHNVALISYFNMFNAYTSCKRIITFTHSHIWYIEITLFQYGYSLVTLPSFTLSQS